MSPAKHIAISIVVLITLMLCFEFTNLDPWVQNFLYNRQSGEWVLSTSNSLLHLLVYDGPKKLLILFELLLLILAIFCHKSPLLKSYQQGVLIILIALPLGPALVSFLKSSTNVACPYALTEYGGKLPYIRVFEAYPQDNQPQKQQRCFPAGHASGGFALLALFYLPKTRRNKYKMVATALTVGSLMGGYKMMVGHHFISHTLISMVVCWLVVNIVALLVLPWPNKDQSTHECAHPETS